MFPDVATSPLPGDPLVAAHDIWKTRRRRSRLGGSHGVHSGSHRGGSAHGTGGGPARAVRYWKDDPAASPRGARVSRPNRGSVVGPFGRPLEPGSVGVMFQHSPLLRHRTVLGNLTLAGNIRGLSAEVAKSRASGLLERFRVAHRASAYPAELSGGERQRLAVAQQMMVPRAVLLLDEPFSGLDPSAAETVRAAIVEAADADDCNTVMLVTHDVHAALAAADQVLQGPRWGGISRPCRVRPGRIRPLRKGSTRALPSSRLP